MGASGESFPPPPPDLVFDAVTLEFVRLVPADLERGFVPFYHFNIVARGAEVGHINFRVGDTAHIRLYAGHIGYAVSEPFRGHKYALQACRALAPFVRSLLASVIITSDPDNFASIRTIELLGGVFLDEVPVPEREAQYARGSRAKRRYRWTP